MLEFVEFLIIVEVVEDVEMAVIPISISIVMAATSVSFSILVVMAIVMNYHYSCNGHKSCN